ncbi:Innexin [Meloidogyne graminicola]|uniref:Innexin n=1 Tax=Meloidogyne graminicola TaxID=189291 RepID=A0A8S9ZWN9_9BILA|nr:Innexin [Meloidogyne graminicola]
MFFHATLARTFISTLKLRGDDDIVDRLNYYYTPIMLAIACLVVSAKQFGGSPIECWINPHSRESMEEYIEAFCWIQNTYWVPMYEHIPDNHETREGQQIGYYQWVPFILIAQALFFSLPCILWRLLNWQNGTNIQHLISVAESSRTILDLNEREKVFNSLALTFTEMIDLRETEYYPHPSSSIFTKFRPTRLIKGQLISFLYLFIKCLYTTNIILQFSLLNATLKSDEYLFYGFQVISDLFSGRAWTKSGHFPRVTLCDFEVRYLANLNRYTFLHFFGFVVQHYFVDYILKFMQIAENINYQLNNNNQFILPNEYGINKFVNNFLKSDGLFILRMIANHAGELAVVGIIKHLWNIFSSRQFNYNKFIYQNEMNNYQEEEEEKQQQNIQQQQQQFYFPQTSTTINKIIKH